MKIVILIWILIYMTYLIIMYSFPVQKVFHSEHWALLILFPGGYHNNCVVKLLQLQKPRPTLLLQWGVWTARSLIHFITVHDCSQTSFDRSKSPPRCTICLRIQYSKNIELNIFTVVEDHHQVYLLLFIMINKYIFILCLEYS